MKKELKLGLVMDDYKLGFRETLWAEALKKVPNIEKYKFVREEIKAGPGKNVSSSFRYFELKVENEV